MAAKPNLRPAGFTQEFGNPSREALLRTVLDHLAVTDPRDFPELLRGLAAALQVASAIAETSEDPPHREVWNPLEREAHRSRVTWEAWILHQRDARQRDLK